MSTAFAETANVHVTRMLTECHGVEMVKLRHCAKFRGDRSYRCRDMAIFQFFKMAAARNLGFVMCIFGPPTKGIGGLYCCAKFGWNRYSSFDNMHVFAFASLAWKRLFKPRKWGAISTKPQKAHPCASPCCLNRYARKSVDGDFPKRAINE